MIIEEEQTDLEIIREAQENLTLSETHDKEIRDESKLCMRFLALKQWEQADLDARAGRISVVIDQLGQYLDQIVNNWRQNRVGIKVSPADDIASDETASIYDGLIRQIIHNSHGHVAIDYAFECLCGGNRGFLEIGLKRRIGSTRRDICILRCPNPEAIYEDPFYTEIDTWDRQWVVKTETISRKVFKAKYGSKAKIIDFQSASQQSPSWFPDSESLLLAQYYRLEETARKIQLLTKPIAVTRNGKILQTDEVYNDEYGSDTIYHGKLPDGVDIATDGDGQPMEDDEPVRKIVKRLLNGVEVLETEVWPGSYIPIVPFYGKEVWYDGKKKLFSAVSRSLDPQKGANYAYSSLYERLGQQIRTPVVGVLGQFKSMRAQWQDSATKPFAFLEVDPVTVGDKPAPMPQRADFDPRLDQTVLATNVIQNSIRATMGINTAILGQDTGKAKSGIAIKELNKTGDTGSFNFPDNGARGVELAGCFIVDLIPKIYDEPELLQIRDEQQQVIAVAVNQDISTMENPPKQQTANHYLTDGKYHVTVSAVPTGETLRMEAAEAMQNYLNLMDPQMRNIAIPVAMRMENDKLGFKAVADKIDPPKDKLSPQQMQAQLQQSLTMIQQMQKAITGYQQEREAETLKLQSDERREAIKAWASIKVAEMKVGTDQQIADADREADHLAQVFDAAHQVALQSAQFAGQKDVADSQVTHTYDPESDQIQPVNAT